MLSTFIFLATILAGKLHDDNGFRGKTFGPASVLDEAPMDGCVKNPEEGVLWTCKTTIGEYPVTTSYMASEGLFTGMVIASSGYTTCEGIKDILSAAWGAPRQENPYIKRFTWSDSPVFASWEMKYDDSCAVVIINLDVSMQAKASRENRAKNAVGDL